MRISRVKTDEAPESIRPALEGMYQQRGNVPNMFRSAAHRPELLETMIRHFRTVMETGTVSTKLKELLAVRVSQINNCHY
ncbi:MAG TPA: carboxymuconolactone decarboxylase family protein [Terriglobales bacterium]|jgi:alkylhydroperoxidase family enzyme